MNDAQAQPLAGTCPTCKGEDGHHYMTCDQPSDQVAQVHDERNPAEGNNELPPATPLEVNEAGDMLPGSLVDLNDLDEGQEEGFDEQKLPPTDDELSSNDMLWLIAKTCHEVNRAYCREVMADHSHVPWEETDEALRLSIYDGVVKHFENPELTPEESHVAWCEYKRAEGWVFGNLKDSVAKTHPCLMTYHQLHSHDRAKDHMFKAVCNAMMGGVL